MLYDTINVLYACISIRESDHIYAALLFEIVIDLKYVILRNSIDEYSWTAIATAAPIASTRLIRMIVDI